MGGSLSSIAAEMVIRKFYQQCVEPLGLVFYLEYVDDWIACVPEGSISTILKSFNEFHPNIKFTFEVGGTIGFRFWTWK